MHGHAIHCFGATIPGHGVQAIDEIGGCLRQRQRAPAQLVRRHRSVAEIVVELRLLDQRERPVHRSRTHAVQPTAPIFAARRGECSTRQLLGIQPVRHTLRRVLANRQGIGYCLAGEFIAEAGHVTLVVVHGCVRMLTRPPRQQKGGIELDQAALTEKELKPGGSSPSPTGRGVGVRVRRSDHLEDRFNHRIQRKQHIVIPEAQHCPSLRLKPPRPCLIAGCLVLRSIQLNNQCCIDTTKICDVGRNRMLTSELEIV